MQVSANGVAFTEQFEGLSLTSYPDPGTGGDPWTTMPPTPNAVLA
jgi:lysozyme